MKENCKNNMTSASNITKGLIALQDKEYKSFHEKLMPTINPDNIIGVRTPMLRNYAKELYKTVKEENAKISKNTNSSRNKKEKIESKAKHTVTQEVDAFLNTLPHQYYEENNLHFALLELKYKKLDEFMEKLEVFLPYIDNWATCDMISAKVFKKDLDRVYQKVLEWVESEHTYTVRFGVVTLLKHYLDDAFDEKHLHLVAGIKSEEYYINMAIAWYFSIALVKQYESTIGYFENPVLEKWTHNKAIQKAIESYRIDADTKDYLRTLKIK